MASPVRIRLAASPMRMSPADIIGLAASAPPEGLISRPPREPQRPDRIPSW